MTLQQTESFVPLTTLPAPGEYRELQVSIIPKAVPTRPLQTLEASGSASVRPGPVAAKKCEPSVSLQCDGDRITNIRVQCTCGQVMDLACVYEPTPKPA
jgi:hypothetical protein